LTPPFHEQVFHSPHRLRKAAAPTRGLLNAWITNGCARTSWPAGETGPIRIGKASPGGLQLLVSEHDRPGQASHPAAGVTSLANFASITTTERLRAGGFFDDQRSRSRGGVGPGHRPAHRGATLQSLV